LHSVSLVHGCPGRVVVVVVEGRQRPTQASKLAAHPAAPISAAAPQPPRQATGSGTPLHARTQAFAWTTTPRAHAASSAPHVSRNAPAQELGGGGGGHISLQLARSVRHELLAARKVAVHESEHSPAADVVERQPARHVSRFTRAVCTHALAWRSHPVGQPRAEATEGMRVREDSSVANPSADSSFMAHASCAVRPSLSLRDLQEKKKARCHQTAPG
jgi:hypothetical protein